MSDGNRSGYGDDPNRGPLDRTADTLTGGTGGLDAALNHDDPNRGPLDRTANAAIGGSGGVANAMGHDDPNRGPLDRTVNAFSDTDDGIGAVGGAAGVSASMGGSAASAMFDTQAEAERVVADLRSAGVDDGALSVIVRNGGTTTARDGGGDVTDEHHQSLARGILGGGALGAGLGVLALAIPGVGPLVAVGAIAANAVPGAIAVGALAGAAAGSFNEAAKAHGLSDEDADYYGEHMSGGGVLVTVSGAASDERVRDILRRHGGHSVSNPRNSTM